MNEKNFDRIVEKLKQDLHADVNFDIVYRVIQTEKRRACICFIDGFCKDELMQKILQYLMDLKEDKEADNAHAFIKQAIPYVEVDIKSELEEIEKNILSAVFAIFMEGYEKCILIDSRTYPARGVTEPDKDKALRGSKDGFVETVIFNTALIRRRIRDTQLRVEVMSIGSVSKTDVVLCYMDNKVDQAYLNRLKSKIKSIKVKALSMNQESLAECIYHGKWWNPFPKFRYIERPDTASAQILEGNVIILVDNSPQAMITPTHLLELMEEADDYYFPPITGTYLRLTRILIGLLTYFITPLFLLFMQHREWIPDGLPLSF